MFNRACALQLTAGRYPQKDFVEFSRLENRIRKTFERLCRPDSLMHLRADHFVNTVLLLRKKYLAVPAESLVEELRKLRYSARRDGLVDHCLSDLFAIVGEVAFRKIGMRYFPHQIKGAWALLQGLVAEMETGQGKSFCATLAASAAGVVGVRTYVITVNEYLAARDAEEFREIYAALGLSVSVITDSMNQSDKKLAYQADIIYCTNKQIVFDYLRDRVTLNNRLSEVQLQLGSLIHNNANTERLILKGLSFAIVDEADSVLVDEAVTPLIISQSHMDKNRIFFYKKALEIARQLQSGMHFRLVASTGYIALTTDGLNKVEQMVASLGPAWQVTRFREELIIKGIRAEHVLLKDKHYVVQDGKIAIVDEFTGRILGDRSWEEGLHQMVELKEECELTQERTTLSRISYQKFFRRFVNLAGMTGTASEVKKELSHVYDLKTFYIAPAQKSKRRINRVRIYRDEHSKLVAISNLVAHYYAKDKAVLVGTRSVAASEKIHELLLSKNLPHYLLNAKNDDNEAAIVAQAGKAPQITVATNMAGRGTDIKLSGLAMQTGGLHVIATELHEARRIDRQLYGRCARQGDPGVVDIIICLEDDLIRKYLPRYCLHVIKRMPLDHWLVARVLMWILRTYCQKKSEHLDYLKRRSVLKSDVNTRKYLAFSGGSE